MNRTAFIGTNLYYSQDFVDDLSKEIEKLNKGYCPIKEKCNKGECDCTNEEYNQMCEENIKLDLEIERLKDIIKEVREYIEENCSERGNEESMWFYRIINADNVLNILKGVDKNGKN